MGSQNIAKYTYTSRNNYLETLAYGNGDSVQYAYDPLGRVTKQTWEDGDTVSYLYNNDGELASVIDSASGITSRYFYDLSGRMMRYTENATDYSHSVTYGYDKVNNLSSVMDTINGAARKTSYTYDSNNRVTKITHGSAGESYTYDSYGRVSTRTNTSGETEVLTDTLTYRELSGIRTSGQVYKLNTKAAGYDITYTYVYGDNGNILSVSDGTNKTTYVYDSANQLVRENNQVAGKTWVWAYDNAGNIENRKEYAYTTGTLGTVVDTIDYDYGDTNWGDLLTKYDGQTITYDAIGNPTSYYNSNRWTLTWEHGRELATISNGTTTWTNTYNANGLRTKRTSGTTTYEYIYRGSQLTQMTVGDDVLKFGYDANGSPMYLQFNNSRYFYATNVQGDIMALVHTSGTAVAEYTYDAWGNILTTTGSMADTVGQINPLRYRGYVYDVETGLYYLQSRYYDPTTGRFLNADALVSTGQGILGNNMFAYCGNNPVNRKDSAGDYWETALDIFFLLVDIYNLAHDNGWQELENWAALGLDLAFTAIPAATGGGLLVKSADQLSDFSKITVIGESMNRVYDFAKSVGAEDNLYNGFRFFDKLSANGKIGHEIATLFQLFDNGIWLLDKLRNNYCVIDVGFDFFRDNRSDYYAVEKFVMSLWEHRHSLKALLDIMLEGSNE